MSSKKIVFAFAATLFTGCASYQVVPTSATANNDLFTPPAANVAKVCVLRDQARTLASTAVVRDNHQLVGATTGDSYFCYLAQPGAHRLVAMADREPGEVMINPHPGETLYLRQYVRSGTTTDETVVSFNPLTVEQAQATATKLQYVALSQVRRGEQTPDASAVIPAAVLSEQVATRPAAPLTERQ